MDELAPICLFVYNRPQETQHSLDALQANMLASESVLYIFSDAPKSDAQQEQVNHVRRIIDRMDGFKDVIIIKADTNKGLSRSIIDGVSTVMQKCGKVIVLEDDLITSPNFLSFMNQALDFYENYQQIISVSGCTYQIEIPDSYSFDVYFTHRMCSYGWGTWKNRWDTIDWEMKDYAQFRKNIFQQLKFMRGGEDLPRMLAAYMKGRIDSWAIRFAYHQFKKNALSVYPTVSKLDNIGFNERGTNTKRKKTHDHITFNPSVEDTFNLTSQIVIEKTINKSFLSKYRIINRIIANYLNFTSCL